MRLIDSPKLEKVTPSLGIVRNDPSLTLLVLGRWAASSLFVSMGGVGVLAEDILLSTTLPVFKCQMKRKPMNR